MRGEETGLVKRKCFMGISNTKNIFLEDEL
jgi:hypothetical protein